MKAKITVLTLVLQLFYVGLQAQPPLVYPVENTGSGFSSPPLLPLSQLPVIQPLTDPFLWADGSGRTTNFADWEQRRNEIRAKIEHYEIGRKPARPSDITATWIPGATPTSGTLRVVVTVNGQSLTLNSAVSLPTGSGPFPALIGMNTANGSLPADIFTSRNIARITFSHNNVTTYGNPQLTDPYYRLYPDQNLDNAGQYSAWAWGVSRIIDGLEMVQSSLPINLQCIAVTGCSYAGKMALYSGAFDERIALTIAQESGGGGAPSWRVSHNIEPAGSVEKIDNTDYRWFREDMRQFSGDNVYKLPHDHHELMAMIAPRALLVTGNTDFTWLSNRSAYVTARAAHEVYKTFGIGDRFGFYIDGGHGHCAIPTTQRPAIEAFVDKFLLGNASVNTNITVHPFGGLDYQRWIQWWGTRTPVLAPLPPDPLGKRIWLEAECATVGSSWDAVNDAEASGGKALVVKPGLSSTTAAPTDNQAHVVVPFMIDSAGTYNFQARLNVPAGEEYSYWMKIDDGAFTNIASQLATNPGFENGLTGWSILNSNGASITALNNPAEAYSGNFSMRVVNPTAWPGNQWRVQVTSTAFPTTAGKQYVISYWVRAASPGGSIRLSTGPSSAQYQGDQAIGTAWQKVTWTITASLSSTTVLFDMGQVANTYYIDEVSIKEVSTGSGWQWVKLREAALSVGSHTLTIGYNAGGGTKLDKLLITTSGATITGFGDAPYNCGGPIYFSKATGDLHDLQTWGLNADGSGDSPADFNDSTFQLNNRSSGLYQMTGDWTVGGRISLPTGGQLLIGNNTLSLADVGAAGTITGSTTSNLTVIGASGGNVSLNFTGGSNMLNNLTLNRTGSLSLGNAVNVHGVLTLTSGALTTNGNLTLKSTAANTARVAPVVSGTITGAVTVERYVPARRAWRILAAPVGGSQTINGAWQEGSILGTATPPNPAFGYGTFITGGATHGSTANGFDQGVPGTATSIKYYNSVVNNWVEQPNTNATAVGSNAFMVFVRGDRGLPQTYNTVAPTPTTLRATGPLKTGDQIFGVNGSGFTAVPNPFASPINFATITRSNVQNNFYVWDPKMGTNGAYVLISYNGSSYDVVPASVSPESQYIQSGQGFLVRPATQGVPGYLVIKESDKSATPAMDVFRTTGSANAAAPVMADPSAGQSIRIRLQVAGDNGLLTPVDEVFASYKNNHSDKLDAFDAVKTANLQENLGLVSGGETLMAERRSVLKEGDALQLKLWNAEQKTYVLEVNPTGLFGSGLSAVLEDKYLQTSTPVSLTEKTPVRFAVSADAASARTDRFQLRIVKNGAEALFTKNAVTAYPNPVSGNQLSLWFDNKAAGQYEVTLVNSAGQVVLRRNLQHPGGSAKQNLPLAKPLAAGTYQLKIAGKGESATISIVSNAAPF